MNSKLSKGLFSYYFIFISWILFSFIIVYLYGYNESFFAFQIGHSLYSDTFFYYFTQVADSAIACSLLILLGINKSKNDVFAGIIAIIVSGLFVQLLKNQIFDTWNRPAEILKSDPRLIIPGEYLFNKSFPSGHGTTTGALFLSLAYIFRDQLYYGIILSILCFILCWSRVYLGVHFPADVLTGAIIGSVFIYGIRRIPYLNDISEFLSKKGTTIWAVLAIITIIFRLIVRFIIP